MDDLRDLLKKYPKNGELYFIKVLIDSRIVYVDDGEKKSPTYTNINFDIDNKNFKNSEQIDKDKLSNLKIYNDISLKSDADIPSKAFLQVEHFTNNYTYQSMIGYTTIDEMNSDVKEYKNLLMGLGIA